MADKRTRLSTTRTTSRSQDQQQVEDDTPVVVSPDAHNRDDDRASLTEVQEQMAAELAQQMEERLPALEDNNPDSHFVIGGEEEPPPTPATPGEARDDLDMFGRMQNWNDTTSKEAQEAVDTFEQMRSGERPSIGGDPMDALNDIVRPSLGTDAGADFSGVPSLYQGKEGAGGTGYGGAVTYTDSDGVKSNVKGDWASEYPTLAKIQGWFTGTKDVAGNTTARGEQLESAMKDINDTGKPAPTAEEQPAPAKTEEQKAEEEYQKGAAILEAMAAEAAAKEAEAGEVKTEQYADDYVDPEDQKAAADYFARVSGWDPRQRSPGDIDPADHDDGIPRDGDPTAATQRAWSGLVGDDNRLDGAASHAGGAPIGDLDRGPGDENITWGEDHRFGAGRTEDVPADIGRDEDISHLAAQITGEESEEASIFERSWRIDGSVSGLALLGRAGSDSDDKDDDGLDDDLDG
jgi:hypothetical protein